MLAHHASNGRRRQRIPQLARAAQRPKTGAAVVSTSTRNFPNRLGKNTVVDLASAELATIASKLGRIPTVAGYQADMGVINKDSSQIDESMDFDRIEEYAQTAKGVTV